MKRTFAVTYKDGFVKEFSSSSFKGSVIKALIWAYTNNTETEIEKVKFLLTGETKKNIQLIVE